MKKKTLRKDIKKCFSKSKGRFISIMCLVALGSFALVGLQIAGPDMRKTSKNYFEALHLADISIIGDYGIDAENEAAINKVSGADKIEYGYLKDVVIADTQDSIRVFSQTDGISEYELVDGRMPKTENEIAVASFLSDDYKLGDTISLSEKADISGNTVLKNHDLKIVGFVNSGELLSIINMGQSTAGTGELQGYAVVTKDAFDSEVYMIARLSFNDTKGIDPYSSEYTKLIQAHKDELDTLLEDQPKLRLDSIKSEYQKKIDDAQMEIDDAKQELDDALKKLTDGDTQLADAKQKYQDGLSEYNKKKSDAESQLSNANQKLSSAKKQIADAESTIAANKTKLSDSEKALQEARKTLDSKWAEYNEKLSQLEELNKMKAQLDAAQIELDKQIAAAESAVGMPIEQIEAALPNLQTALPQAQYKQLCTLIEAKKALEEKWTAYNAVASQAANAKEQLAQAKTELDNAKTKISDNEQELADGWKEYNEKKPDANREIADAEEKVKEAQDSLNRLKTPVYAIDTRREIPGSEGYRIYSSVSNIVDSLADIFPIFLYFVAALVTLTTMTRFVDEERINSGTLKALGYANKDIVKKFTVYGFAASMTGAVIGIAAGHILLPTIVYNAYGHSFTYPHIELHFYPVISVIAILLAFLCAVIPAFIVANRELQEKPSALLQPKPPKAGSKIFLERIRPLWNKMSFTHKVTARNIFRYKKRMLMTVFGVCGSVTLIFAGFSVQHSVSGIKECQFGEIMKYDLIAAQNDGITDKQQNEINQLLNSDSIRRHMPIHYEAVTKIAGNNEDKQEIKLIVPQDADALSEYITLTARGSGKQIKLTPNGCVISERLAKLLNVRVGDSFTLTDAENNQQTVTVSDITEMYVGHFIFMSSEYYESALSKDFSQNAHIITLKDRTTENAKTQASLFMELNGVKGVVQNTTMMGQIDTIVKSLNRIMDILIVVAMLLAIVILYNLNNINVSERIRELSTIKVLGFYNNEVTLYIYRETILLTLLGILVGYGFGDILFRYIITVVPPDEVMFNPALGAKAFIIPVIVVSLITLVLGLMVNRRLKCVDMLEALKSVE